MEPKIDYTAEGEKIHYSVGAIITNDKGEYLLIDRLKQPFGFACPAGHIDEGEHRLTALLREVEEETGLIPWHVEEIFMDSIVSDFKVIPNEPCSRGVKNHVWYLYYVKANGELIFKADEVKSIDWYSIEQIKELPLESIWKHWLTELKII